MSKPRCHQRQAVPLLSQPLSNSSATNLVSLTCPAQPSMASGPARVMPTAITRLPHLAQVMTASSVMLALATAAQTARYQSSPLQMQAVLRPETAPGAHQRTHRLRTFLHPGMGPRPHPQLGLLLSPRLNPRGALQLRSAPC